MIRVYIEESLRESWQPVVERQLQLTLASVAHDLQGELRFSLPRDGGGYQCEFRGRASRGTRYRASARSADGRAAVVDALARVRRSLARERQLSRRSTPVR